jgi:hypothetical protein
MQSTSIRRPLSLPDVLVSPAQLPGAVPAGKNWQDQVAELSAQLRTDGKSGCRPSGDLRERLSVMLCGGSRVAIAAVRNRSRWGNGVDEGNVVESQNSRAAGNTRRSARRRSAFRGLDAIQRENPALCSNYT